MSRKKKPRCTTCGAPRKGHDGPTGEKCNRAVSWDDISNSLGDEQSGTRGERMAKSIAGGVPESVSVTGSGAAWLDSRQDEVGNPALATPPRL